jgi:hypothetical protein
MSNVHVGEQPSVPTGYAPAVAVSQVLPPRFGPSQTSPASMVVLPHVADVWQRSRQVLGAVPVQVQTS